MTFATDTRGRRVNLNHIEYGGYTGDAEWTGWTSTGTKYVFSSDPTAFSAYWFAATGEGIAFAEDEEGLFTWPLDLIGWTVDENLEWPTPVFADGTIETQVLLIGVNLGKR